MNTSTLTARQRLEFRAARLLSELPPAAQTKLSGKPPVCIDGQTLEPDLQLTLSLLERRGAPPLETLPPPKPARRSVGRSLSRTGNRPP